MTKMTPMEIVEWLDAAFATGDREDKMDQAVATLRAFIEANTPWLPPQQEGFGPWIEWKPGDPGPRVNDEVLVLSEIERKKKYAPKIRGLARDVAWENTGRSAIVAYCVKLPEVE